MEEDGDNESLPEETFSQLPISSIRIMAESVINHNTPDEALNVVAGDLNYRTRYITNDALQYMKHAHRRFLIINDVNLACESYSECVIGHSNPSPPSYIQIEYKINSSAQSTLFFVPEKALDLEKIVTTSKSFESLPLPQVSVTWAVINGAVCPPFYFSRPSSETMPPPTPVPGTTAVSKELTDYYNAVTGFILGNDETLLKCVISDLQTNVRISPLLPHFVNFIMAGFNRLSHDIYQLTKLLQTIKSLVINPNLFIGHEPYLTSLVQCVFNCVVKEFPVSVNKELDHWEFRESAAQLLAKIHRNWASPVNGLYHTTLCKFEGIFEDLEHALCSHYGAIVGVMAFGVEAMEKFLYPHMPSYMTHLSTILNDHSHKNVSSIADAQKVYNMLMSVSVQIIWPYIAETFFTSETKISHAPSSNHPQATNAFSGVCMRNCESEEQPENSEQAYDSQQAATTNHAFQMYKVFYGYFGDGFRNSLPWIPTDSVYVPPKQKWLLPFSPPTKEINDHLIHLSGIDPSKSKRRSSDDFDEMKFMGSDMLERKQAFTRDKQSDRFHSDHRSACNLGSCDDLQVSELVSDPNSGVKLVIAKRNTSSPKPKLAKKPIEIKIPKTAIKVDSPPKPIFEDTPDIRDIRQENIHFDLSEVYPVPLEQKKCESPNLQNNLTYSVFLKHQKNLKLTEQYSVDALKWSSQKMKSMSLADTL